MRINTLTTIFLAGLVSCGRMNKEESKTTEMAIQDLELNEIVHDSLTTEQVNAITRIHNVFAEVNSTSLDETINNFKKDQHPDYEIAIWLKMADAYERFTLTTDKVGHDKKNEAYELILLRSMMTEEEVLDKLTAKFLTEDEIKEILSYYEELPHPLKVAKK